MNTAKSPKATKGGSLSPVGRAAPAVDPRDNGDAHAASGNPFLSPFQVEAVSLFVGAFSALSLPRSIGEIYGLLFSTEEPLSLDDVVERLRISKGSASEGLRWLKSLGAVNLVYVPGVRREHFTAETSLRKLASGYLRDRIDPHLDNGQERLRALESSIDGNGGADFQRGRLGQVRGWYQFISKVLPIVKTLAGKF